MSSATLLCRRIAAQIMQAHRLRFSGDAAPPVNLIRARLLTATWLAEHG